MKGMLVAPVEMDFLLRGEISRVSLSFRAACPDRVAVGTPFLKEEQIEHYIRVWEALGATRTHPVAWSNQFDRGGLTHTARLGRAVAFNQASISTLESLVFTRQGWVVEIEQIEPLPEPLSITRQYSSALWEIDLDHPERKSFLHLTPQELTDFYNLCELIEQRWFAADIAEQARNHPGFFITHLRFARLRAEIFYSINGEWMINRRHWRRIFAKRFPDFVVKEQA